MTSALEPRDCLQLWKAMSACQDEAFPIAPEARTPTVFLPPNFTKSDVLGWERELKLQLHSWMVDPRSPFSSCQDKLRRSASPERPDQNATSLKLPLYLSNSYRSHGGPCRRSCSTMIEMNARRSCLPWPRNSKKPRGSIVRTNPAWKKKMASYGEQRLAAAKSRGKQSKFAKQPGHDKGRHDA